LDNRREEAGRERVVLARGVEDSDFVALLVVVLADGMLAAVDEEGCAEVGEGVKYPLEVGDGRRDEAGVETGVLSVEYNNAGGTHELGLPGSLVLLELDPEASSAPAAVGI
jgi:hypothetical protein